MDVCESKHQPRKHAEVDTSRPPLVPAERNNAVTSRRPQTRDVSSRYRSPSPSSSTTSASRRCQSPTPTRTARTSSQLAPNRSQSAERKRPSTPPSPSSTPVKDSSIHIQISTRKVLSGRLPEGLWPSTMRSLNVSFQSDSISVPVSKKEKPVTSTLSERPLRPSSNVHKQVETPMVARKPTLERKRSPLTGKNVSDLSENSKPVDSLPSRLMDQHRWPCRTGGKVLSNSLSKSVDVIDKMARTSIPPVAANKGLGLSLRRLSLDGVAKPLQKTPTDAAKLLSIDDRVRMRLHSIDDNHLRVSGAKKLIPEKSLDKVTSTISAVRSQSFHSPISHPSSPSKTSVLSSSACRGVSPSRIAHTRGISPTPARHSTSSRGISPTPARSSNPVRGTSPTPARPSTPPRGISPSRMRPYNSSGQTNSSASVLSFIADFRNGKKSSSYIEDAHQLRLVYNRYLQWRFANARADAALHIKKVIAEKTLYNVWNHTQALCDTVILKRVRLQQLRLELKLNSLLNGQMALLDDWALIERDHASSLSGAVEDFEASTLRLPVTEGARVDVESLKLAVCSAVDVMQTMGSSICSLLSRVEMMNSLVSELAFVALQENDMLDQCEALLTSTAAMQVEECSLRTHVMQMRAGFEN